MHFKNIQKTLKFDLQLENHMNDSVITVLSKLTITVDQ